MTGIKFLPLITAAVLVHPIPAATYTWDADGTTGSPTGGAGTWDATSALWDDSGTMKTWAAGNTALFGGSAGAVTVAAGISANSLLFSADGYQLSGGDITLTDSGNNAFVVNSGVTATVNSSVAKSSGETWIRGGGTLILGGSNTFNNSLVVSEGSTLEFSSAANIAGSGGVFINGGNNTLRYSGSSDYTLKASATAYLINNSAGNKFDVTGSGAFTIGGAMADNGGASGFSKTGSGTLVLTAANTYTGTTSINGGVLSIGNGGTTGTLGTGSVTNNASLVFNRSNDLTVANTISGSGTLTKQGAGVLTLSGTNDYSGKTTVSGGTVSISADANLGAAPGSAVTDQLTLNGGTLKLTAALTLSATRGITIGGSGGTVNTVGLTSQQVVIAGPLTGTAGLVVNAHGNMSASGGGDPGYFRLSGDNSSLSGGITVNSGLLEMSASANALGSNTVTLNGGGLLNASDPVITRSNNIVVGAGGGTLRNYGSAETNLTGTISGAGNLNLTDGGAWTFAGTNTGFSGKITLANFGVRLGINGDAALGAVPGSYVADAITIASGASLLNMTQATGGTGFSAGFDVIIPANRGITLSGGAGTIQVGYGKTFTVNSIISGPGVLQHTDSGVLALNGVNTYSGGTENLAGTLQVSALSGIGSGYLAVKSNSTFRYTGSGSETTTRALWLNNGAATFDIADSAAALTWNPSAGAQNQAFTKTGTGKLTMGGAFSGGAAVTVSGGTLVLNGSSSHSGATTINPGATLSISSDGNLGSGVINFRGTGGSPATVLATGSFSTDNIFDAVGTGYRGDFNVDGGQVLTLTAAGAIRTYSGSWGFSKKGAGTLVLTADNGQQDLSFRLDAGTVELQSGNALGGSDGVWIDASGGTTLSLKRDTGTDFFNNLALYGDNANLVLDRNSGGVGVTHKLTNITFSNSYTLNVSKGANVTSGRAGLEFDGFPQFGTVSGNTATFNVGADVDVLISGSLTGTQSFAKLAKSGAGTLILGGNNDWWDPSGANALVTVNGGTLELRHQNAMGDGTNGGNSIALSMAGGTTLRVATNTPLGNWADTTITGDGVTLIADRATAGAGITNQFDVLSVNGAYTLNVSGGSNVTSGTAQLNFNSTTIAGNATLNVANPAGGGSTVLSLGSVDESGGSRSLAKIGNGTVRMNAVNTFSGALAVNGGIYDAAAGTSGAASALGSGTATNVVTVGSGATLLFSAVRGAGYHSADVNVNGGTITFNNSDISLGSGRTITFDTAPGTFNGTGQWRMRDTNVKVAVTAAASGSTISVTDLRLTTGSGGVHTFEVADGTQADDLTISSAINGHFGGEAVTKTGAGTLKLTGANTYTGATSINGGTLLMGASNVIPGASTVKLGGGTLNAAGYSNTTSGTLDLLSSSTIDFGTSGSGDAVLSFSNLNRTAGTLSVWNWTGALWSSGGTEQLKFTSGTVGDFTNVQFYSDGGSTPLGAGGRFVSVAGGVELVPVPEPGAVLASLLLLAPAFSRRRNPGHGDREDGRRR